MSYLTHPLGFTKKEFIVVFTILATLIVVILVNLQISFTKSRDLRRKNDIGAVSDALDRYQTEFGFFPLSDNEGRILACIDDPQNPTVDDLGNVVYEHCEWGQDALRDVFDESYPPYLNSLPIDPQAEDGASYKYISNGKRYQLFASLERSADDEYEQEIIQRQLECGNRICNFGKSFSTTPLDKSIEEYENEIREKEQL